MNCRGYYFSVDAFIALVIVLGVIVFIRPPISDAPVEIYIQNDLLSVLSEIKVGEINNSYIQSLVSDGNITHLNNSVLEQIAEFYAVSDSRANLMAESIFSDLNLSEGLAIYFEDNLVANSTVVNFTSVRDVRIAREVISGIAGGANASSGFSSRAYLSSGNKIKYYYFGGYVGDGNISFNLGEDVVSASVEADFNGDFDVLINGNYVNSYSPTLDVPYYIDLSSYSSEFLPGENNISFESEGALGIAGGYIRVVYNDSSLQSTEKNLPGIKGFINIYDGIYIPSNLTGMEIFLHYNSSYDIFMTIGNDEVYLDNSSGSDLSVIIDNSTLFSIMNYNDVLGKTLPFRIGIKNVSEIEGLQRDADVFSVTDLSGSMDDCGEYVEPYICEYGCFFGGSQSCEVSSPGDCADSVCGGIWCWGYSVECDKDLLDLAKEANIAFIDVVLNYSGNRVGLVGYAGSVDYSNTHDLSDDNVSLNSMVNSWSSGGATCICCGINDAVSKINSQSSGEKFKSIVVMSDGEANVGCAEQGVTSDLNGNGVSDDAGDDAIAAACSAYNDYGIKVYSVGFGSGADVETLQDISSCGQGDFHYGDVDELVDIYRQIAKDILNAAYDEQRLIGEGKYNVLYPDSKISYEYDDSDNPYGVQMVLESSDFGNTISEGSYDIPIDSVFSNVGVVSYSGSKWTSLVEVYNSSSDSWEVVYNLTDYGSNYTDLGDPYIFNIPISKVVFGENKVRVRTAANSSSMDGGSEYNKVIYSLLRDVAGYSPVLPMAQGCIWNIEFEDGSNATMTFPSTYTGSDECYFASDDYFFTGDNVVLPNSNDAINRAILNLFNILDVDGDSRVDAKFTESDMDLSSVEVDGLPFTWETEVQVRGFR